MPANKISFQQYAERNTQAGGDATAPFAAILSYELAHTAVSRPHSVGYVAFEEVMNKTFSDIRNGADAAAALVKADQALKAAFARIR
jgi:multiple sugar transport system substrate-binding protein